MISSLAVKFVSGFGKRAIRMTTNNILRMSSTDDPCSPKDQGKQEPCQPKKQDVCPPKQETCPPLKAEPCTPKSEPCSQPPVTKCSEPSPCTAVPKCPPPLCAPVLDRNNPCNYCPPPCIDPDYPDLTKLKKYQCLFQQDDDIPVYLKRGKIDAFLYQFSIVLALISFIAALTSVFKLIK